MIPFLSLSRLHKQIIAVTADIILLPLTFCLAIWLRHDGLNSWLLHQYGLLITALPLISIPIFIKLGLYRAVIRFIDHKIVYVVVFGVTLSVIALGALGTFTQTAGYSRAVFGIYWVSAILYVTASRFLARSYLLRASGVKGVVRVAIYGAGQAGTQLASALRAGNEYLPVAFIDDKKELNKASIAGIKVHTADDLPNLIARYNFKEILLAMPSLSKLQQKHILDKLEPLKVKIKVTPPIKSLINGELRVQDIREVEIEDLLGRDPVEPNPDLISACITNKSVLVTGAGGSIGSELCRQIIRQRPSRLILLEMSEFGLYAIEQELAELQRSLGLKIELLPFLSSVLETEKCTRIMRTFGVETVYHAAAYKHVPLVEHNPIEGIRNNVFGTLSVAKAAMAAGVKSFVLISTDKAVRPTNVMGSTKRFAELILQAFSRVQAKGASKTRFCMVRFGNVLGSSGSVVPLFRKQIMAGGPLTLTHPEITRYFMTIPEAAQLVLQASAMGQGGDVFVLDMGDPVKIIDLATRMVHLSGLDVLSDLTPDGTIEINHVGLRPGEKLYEELLIGENVEGTEHPLIMRAQEVEIPWVILEGLLNKLEEACANFDHEEVRELLLRTVAEYTPQCGIEDFIWRAKRHLPEAGDTTLH
ncbi:NDP-sugar epimerase, includes UDP-GlcNAc-inverting 4,6-dehydratase FlaA1 and capsular polysaccharide biosynthesis protein EpsC [Collimonas sp. OK307]|uniref:polysaccharide biosynthesis protein n=1 Tax=Collimonas sp. OK307 TaxID=1801620 RepID=UPI0008DEEA8C|nr:nucleoside-diphosphate sugar epimerase/dehydratase [Collimonas sp. OK307]SFH99484.1 NDP-sugar epimerase, includes UDP-GlcNAc-inverting 4,6-dehydratase FlaA1 and capsular polysaccharide biosynthesis protein EpsC [Collimonas sp. OK307]